MGLATRSPYAILQIKLLSSNETENEKIPLKTSIDSIIIIINLISMFFGIIGNSLCICVFCRKLMIKTRFNLYLLTLACIDLTFCWIVFTGYLVRYPNAKRSLYDLNRVTCYFYEYILNLLDSFSVLLALIMSIDRFYAVIYPVKSRFFCTNLYPLRVITLIFLLVVTANVPYLIYNQRIYVSQPSDSSQKSLIFKSLMNHDWDLDLSFLNKKAKQRINAKDLDHDSSEYDSDYENEANSLTHKRFQREVKTEKDFKPFCKYNTAFDGIEIKKIQDVYVYIINPLILNILPAFIIVFLNILLLFFLRFLWKSTKKSKSDENIGLRYQSGPALSKENRSNCFVIICLAGWILITSMPYYGIVAYDWVNLLKANYYKSKTLMEVQAIVATLFNTNHVINMLVYLIFHGTFSKSLKKMIYEIVNCKRQISINSNDTSVNSVISNKNPGNVSLSRSFKESKCLIDKESKKTLSEMFKKSDETEVDLNNEHYLQKITVIEI